MAFLEHPPVPVRPDIAAAFEREWARLAGPGSSWTGSERVDMAAAARSSREGGAPSERLPDAAIAVAVRLGAEPGTMNRQEADRASAAVGVGGYVELVGVVARTAAVDAFHVALGVPLPEFPEPVAGSATARLEAAATTGPAWVPMVGGSSIVNALSLMPDEAAAQEDLHGPLYLTYDQMEDLTFRRGLHRAQMELVAARTSALNECFY